MVFTNRWHAGTVLAKMLGDEITSGTVVAGVLKGGLETAAAVASWYRLPLYPVPVRKIRSPQNPEFALGALTTAGSSGFSDPESDVFLETDRQLGELIAAIPVTFRDLPENAQNILIIDDGIATGNTMRAAAALVSGQGYAKPLLAAPVAAKDAYLSLLDDYPVIVHLVEADFRAVGQYYCDFGEVTMARVLELLRQKDYSLKGGIA